MKLNNVLSRKHEKIPLLENQAACKKKIKKNQNHNHTHKKPPKHTTTTKPNQTNLAKL